MNMRHTSNASVLSLGEQASLILWKQVHPSSFPFSSQFYPFCFIGTLHKFSLPPTFLRGKTTSKGYILQEHLQWLPSPGVTLRHIFNFLHLAPDQRRQEAL